MCHYDLNGQTRVEWRQQWPPKNKKAVLLQGNGAMQRVFPTPSDSSRWKSKIVKNRQNFERFCPAKFCWGLSKVVLKFSRAARSTSRGKVSESYSNKGRSTRVPSALHFTAKYNAADTRPILTLTSPKFTGTHKLLIFKIFGAPPSPLGCALASLGQSLVRVKIWEASTPKGRNVVSKNSIWVVESHMSYFFVSGIHLNFFADAAEIVVDRLSFRFWISCLVPEIFAMKGWRCVKSTQIFARFWPQFFWGGSAPKFWDLLYYKAHPDIDHVAKFGRGSWEILWRNKQNKQNKKTSCR